MFFRKRQKTVTVNGRSKPIFHIVRAHRRLRGNTERLIKTHFRGERKFMWQGYDITITMPGLHHTPIEKFDIPGFFADDHRTPQGPSLGMVDLGEILKADQEEGFTAMKSRFNELSARNKETRH